MRDFAFTMIAYVLPAGFCGFIFGLATGRYLGRGRQ